MNSIENVSKLIGIALLATIIVVATAASLVLASDFFMLIFLGILFGVFLTKTSELVGRFVPLGYGWRLGLITLCLFCLASGSLVLFGVKIEQRLDATSEQLDKSAEKLEEWLNDHPIASTAFRKIPFSDRLGFDLEPRSGKPQVTEQQSRDDQAKDRADREIASSGATPAKTSATGNPKGDDSKQSESSGEDSESMASSKVVQTAAGKVFGMLGQLLTTTFGAFANVGVVFFVGIFIAVDPTLYRDGLVQLFPPKRRERVTEILNMIGDSMFKWLNGRFLAMLITGSGTTVALLILGVPMPFTIGIITGLLNFVPNIGALLSLALAMLMALSQGPMTVVWVIVLYALLQFVESNIITPLVQQHQTSIPPALLLAFQITMGALTGILGITVATPLLAATIVLVKEAWVKDILEASNEPASPR